MRVDRFTIVAEGRAGPARARPRFGRWLRHPVPLAAILSVVLFSATLSWIGLGGWRQEGHSQAERLKQAPSAIDPTAEGGRPARFERRGNQRDSTTVPGPVPRQQNLSGAIILSILDTEGQLSGVELESLKTELDALRGAGSSAIPLIRDLLDRGVDRSFHPAAAAFLGHATFRLVLLDLLARIGDIGAERLLADQLGSFRSPAELEALADALESLQPGYYTEAILDLAREKLGILFESRGAREEVESAPLFRILRNYGDDTTAALLVRAPDWLGIYAQLALADLPESDGVEALIRYAQRDANVSGDGLALHLLAQSAVTNRHAQAALLYLAQAGGIGDADWPAICEILVGDRQLQTEDPSLAGRPMGSITAAFPYTTHTVVDRQVQTVYRVNYSAVLSPGQVESRMALLIRMTEIVDSTVALDSLWAAYDSLLIHYPPPPR